MQSLRLINVEVFKIFNLRQLFDWSFDRSVNLCSLVRLLNFRFLSEEFSDFLPERNTPTAK